MTVAKKRRCSGCQHVFLTPAALMKHLDKGRCRPVTHFAMYGLVPSVKGGWELVVPTEKPDGR